MGRGFVWGQLASQRLVEVEVVDWEWEWEEELEEEEWDQEAAFL